MRIGGSYSGARAPAFIIEQPAGRAVRAVELFVIGRSMVVAGQEEKRLFREYHRTRDPRTRDVLVQRYLPLARSLARRYRHSSEPLEDLEQVASLALQSGRRLRSQPPANRGCC